MSPLVEQMGTVNQGYKQRFEQLDQTLQLQFEQSAADVQHYLDDHFTVTLAAQLADKKTTSSGFGTYAAIGAATLAAVFAAGFVYKSRKSVSTQNSYVNQALVN